MREKCEERGTVIERRRGQEGPEAEHDGLKNHGEPSSQRTDRESEGDHREPYSYNTVL